MSFSNLRRFINELKRQQQLIEINAEVDPYLELAEIHRRIIAEEGPALLFTKVRGHKFPVVTNLFGTAQRTQLAFGHSIENTIKQFAQLPEELFPFSLSKLWTKLPLLREGLHIGIKKVRKAPVMEQVQIPPRFSELPLITSWPADGGAFITLPLVYTQHPDTGIGNLGMYRIQRFSDTEAGLHFQIGKGGGFHLAAAKELGLNLPVHVFVGGPPAAILAAIAPLPENIPELLLCSAILEEKVPVITTPYSSLPVLAEAEFALIGECNPLETKPEGPFGDHYGYYSLKHNFPFMRCSAILHRRDAIYPATIVGKPRQEDYYIGEYLQRLLSPLFPLVMPLVKDLWSYGETGFHALATVRVHERHKREAMTAALRILGEGQLALTKFLLVIDGALDLRDVKAVLEYLLERTKFESDLYIIPNLSLDTLDYTGPKLNEGSRGIFLGLGNPIRTLPRDFSDLLPAYIDKLRVFCGGTLLIGINNSSDQLDIAKLVTTDPVFATWPLVIIVDDVEFASYNSANFLWSVFTRFDPASDIYAGSSSILQNHLALSSPIVIDSRMKKQYPGTVETSDETAKLVNRRWKEYFS